VEETNQVPRAGIFNGRVRGDILGGGPECQGMTRRSKKQEGGPNVYGTAFEEKSALGWGGGENGGLQPGAVSVGEKKGKQTKMGPRPPIDHAVSKHEVERPRKNGGLQLRNMSQKLSRLWEGFPQSEKGQETV